MISSAPAMEDPRPDAPDAQPDASPGAEVPAAAVPAEAETDPAAPAQPESAAPESRPEPPVRDEPDVSWLPAARLDVPLAVLLGVLMLGLLLPVLGVWEPWEAQQSAFALGLRDAGAWLVAELPKLEGKAPPRFELPFIWWPVRVSLKLLGENELGLRLPGFIASLGLLAVVMATARALWGRLAGWLSVLALLGMPLFVFHGRQNFGVGLGMAALGIATLALVRRTLDPEAGPRWLWLGWGFTALSALTGALVGLLVPVATAVAAGWAHRHLTGTPGALRRLLGPAPVAVAAVLVAAGWGAAFAALPDGAAPWTLLWLDPHELASLTGSTPTFERATHQLGFGLFPYGALLPFAFGTALWRDDAVSGPAAGERAAEIGLSLGFTVAFLVSALFAPLNGTPLFPGDALVASVVGAYLARALRAPPSPVLATGAVLLLMLLDSNLKHDPKALATTLLSAKLDQFPPELAGWSARRLVTGGLIAVLLLYQGGLVRWIARTARFALYPQRRLRFFHWGPAVLGVGAGAGLWIARLDAMLTFVNQRFWGVITIPWRNFLVLLAVGVLVHILAWLGYNLWVRLNAGRTEGRLSRWALALEGRLVRPASATIALTGMLTICAAYMAFPVALGLTANFSQKAIVERFNAASSGEEKLYKYKVDAKSASFYTRGLPDLTPTQFKDMAKADARFFAVIPRPQLAAINSEFRAASGQTLPVLDASSFRFLLVSNRLGAGETDENPITGAIVAELPKDKIRPSKVNFDDQIELAGWYIDPPEPKTGARITITLYWRALKKVTRTWKVFMHIDAPGARVHGDHDPVEGLYPTNNWNAGDIIKDVYSVPFAMSNPAGRYTVWAGLYSGQTRAPVKSGDKDNENRAKLGFINVR